LIGIEPPRIVLRPLLKLDDDQFLQLCAQNPEQPFEQTAQGEVIIVSPTGSHSGSLENKILYQLTRWNEEHQRGVVFSSSSLFRFPKGSIRSPDATWIEISRWEGLTSRNKGAIDAALF
jgi:Uma2 family endonuclease